ncbi:MAG TPA: type IVB secretion system protein IcmW [Gammaproteobacteria bacterium]|jgi:intracellular multiplication protein IcmW|nr:type IVB secretion system protein IcmW [Gammaproteobacteria bacterium]
MPKLDLASAHEYWKSFDDQTLYQVVTYMEAVETFTLDGNPELETALEKIGDALDKISVFELNKEEQIVAMSAHLKTSRILRLLQAIDTIDPGSASKILIHAEESNTAGNIMAILFLKRNIAFERLRLLSRVFSVERCNMVLQALEQDHA